MQLKPNHYSVHNSLLLHSKKMLGCFNPILGQIWTNVGLKMSLKHLQLKVKVDVGL